MNLRPLWLASVLAALCAQNAKAQAGARDFQERAGIEGALGNDALLPLNTLANATLATADRKFAVLATQPVGADARAWTEVLEGWHVALQGSVRGDMVQPAPLDALHDGASPWPDRDGTCDAHLDRRHDGVEYAVLRRLSAASPDLRALWRERFDPLALDLLRRARRDANALASLERTFPATEPAARAALMLADLELERARPRAALAWLERARRHVELGALEQPRWNQALEARTAVARSEPAAPRPPAPQAWETARRLTAGAEWLVASAALRQGAGSNEVLQPRAAPGRGLRGGMCFLDGDGAALQVPGIDEAGATALVDRIALIDLAQAKRSAVFAPARLLDELGVSCGALDQPDQAPGWALLPATDGRALVLTLGRRGYERGNALMCLEFEAGGVSAPPLPHLRWAWCDGVRVAGPGPASAGCGADTEFQPGPLVCGDDVYVVLREYIQVEPEAGATSTAADANDPRPLTSAEVRTWLVDLDLATGALRWRTLIAQGFELQRGSHRVRPLVTSAASAQPPAEVDGRIFVGTNTGVCALVDALDGRVCWALKGRRRDPDLRTWSGARAPTDAALAGATGSVLWASPDSDRLYRLRAAPDLDGQGVLLAPPIDAGAAEALIGGDARSALVLARNGDELALESWTSADGRILRAAFVAAGESFAGDGLCSASRALFATDRSVWLVDRERELRLLDNPALRPVRTGLGALEPNGGSLFADGRWVCVLGPTSLWLFSAVP